LSLVAVKKVQVKCPRLPAAFDGITIAHLSDIHARRWSQLLSAVRDELRSCGADLVVITGDMDDRCENSLRAAELIGRILEGVPTTFGCFGVLGNHDDPQLAAALSDHLQMLSNENVSLDYKGSRIFLTGIDGRTRTSWDLPSALYSLPADSFTILLAHFPTSVFHLPNDRVDLLLAGHTHAGQIRLPFVGSIWPSIDGLPHKYCWGLHQMGSTSLHVSAGVGCAYWIPFRIFCRPEIALLQLSTV